MQGVKDLTIGCSKKPEMGRQEGEGRKKAALREWMRRVKHRVAACLNLKRGRKETLLGVIELRKVITPSGPEDGIPPRFCRGSVGVEEYEV